MLMSTGSGSYPLVCGDMIPSLKGSATPDMGVTYDAVENIDQKHDQTGQWYRGEPLQEHPTEIMNISILGRTGMVHHNIAIPAARRCH